jgi:hypothetical protein
MMTTDGAGPSGTMKGEPADELDQRGKNEVTANKYQYFE